jgi:hypothetical protein
MRIDNEYDNSRLYVSNKYDKITIWNTSTGVFINKIDVQDPKQINFSKNSIFVTSPGIDKDSIESKEFNVEEGGNFIYEIDKESLEIKRRIIGNWFSPCLLNIEANGNILLTAFSFNEYIMLPEMRYFIIIDKNGKIIKKIEIEGLEGLKKFHDIISLNNKIIASDDTKLKIFEFV